jgi:quercetin dioxygenase-like cupin family protein
VRNIVQSFPASGAPAEQVSVATAAFAPGAKLAFHTHPGEETGVVISGLLMIEMDGKPTLMLKPGDSYVIPRGVAHQVSAPQGETHVVATFIVDKDKPLATPRP